MLGFLKRKKTASEFLLVILTECSKATATLLEEERASNNEIPTAQYARELDCLYLFIVFTAIQRSRFSQGEKELLLACFRDLLSGEVRVGRADPQVEMNLQDYCDALNAPDPSYPNPVWSIGVAFSRHCGAERDIAYINFGGTTFAKTLTETVKFFNTTANSYRITDG